MTSAEPATDVPPAELVSLTIDGDRVAVPQGTLLIRAAELIGIQIPRFCDHPLLEPVGACRQCLVEVEGQIKPMASCTTAVGPDMVVRTQRCSDVAESAQRQVMELLLINHPLDCPVCDKGGECPLQNQAMSHGRSESRFAGPKRTHPKPITLSSQILLDRERCVLCARCTRFSDQVAGDAFIDLLERGAQQQVGVATNEPLQSYFSGNTVQICPVGALTGKSYRFRARPFDLVSSPSICEHCASGCAQRTDHRRGKVLRRLAGDDPEVNEEWNCDKGRWGFAYARLGDRITSPLVREAGRLRAASWPEAIAVAATGLFAAAGNTGVLVGGRVTTEDAYAYGKFARMVLRTNDIDFRIRQHSAEEADFLAARVAGEPMTVTYADLERASTVVLVGLEPEEESPAVFLRLRKAFRTRGVSVIAIAPFATRGLMKCNGVLVPTAPGAEAAALDALAADLPAGAIILVGERLAASTGAYSAVARLAESTGASLAWIPRRAGDRGAVEAGCLPNLLPGGRPLSDNRAREQITAAWRTADLPGVPGRDTMGILTAAARGELAALLLGAVEVNDLPDPRLGIAALDAAPFVVSLEIRENPVTQRADVVFPVASVAEKAGSFRNWEGRVRQFGAALPSAENPDLRVLHTLAERMGVDLGCPAAAVAAAELDRIGTWAGRRRAAATVVGPSRVPRAGQAVLASWRMLLDDGRALDGEPNLAGTARASMVRLSADTAAEIGVTDGDRVTVRTDRGAVTLPLAVTAMPDRVVWLPLKSPGCAVHRDLEVGIGAVVGIEAGDVR